MNWRQSTRLACDRQKGDTKNIPRHMKRAALDKQKRTCNICGCHLPSLRCATWDHCHDAEPYLGKIGSFRGMLCFACNTLEGQLRSLANRSGMSRKNCVVKLLQHSKMHAEHWPEGTL